MILSVEFVFLVNFSHLPPEPLAAAPGVSPWCGGPEPLEGHAPEFDPSYPMGFWPLCGLGLSKVPVVVEDDVHDNSALVVLCWLDELWWPNTLRKFSLNEWARDAKRPLMSKLVWACLILSQQDFLLKLEWNFILTRSLRFTLCLLLSSKLLWTAPVYSTSLYKQGGKGGGGGLVMGFKKRGDEFGRGEGETGGS